MVSSFTKQFLFSFFFTSIAFPLKNIRKEKEKLNDILLKKIRNNKRVEDKEKIKKNKRMKNWTCERGRKKKNENFVKKNINYISV